MEHNVFELSVVLLREIRLDDTVKELSLCGEKNLIRYAVTEFDDRNRKMAYGEFGSLREALEYYDNYMV